MATSRGVEHCNWESVIFLEMAWPVGSILRLSEPGATRVFVRDPDEDFEVDRGGFSSDATLPSDAEATGFTHRDWELWISADPDGYVFLVGDERVERWPESEEVGCD